MLTTFLLIALAWGGQPPVAPPAPLRVAVAGGVLEGSLSAHGIRQFRGVPYAAPPVGHRRWQPPQPAAAWAGVRPARKFGPRPMQLPLYGDMNFRSDSMSENCLYLNVWTGASTARERRPVLVYFYGGGFGAGDGSEPRYDGEALARQGIVTVTVNYRLGVFGFLAHPDLVQESAQHAAGNYGLLDQQAALRWIHANVTAFGGDPTRITIAGESAGSVSVSAQLAAPGSRGLFAQAIGESGSLLSPDRAPRPLAEATQAGALLAAAGQPAAPRFRPVVDGYFLTEAPLATYSAGRQAHVPLLVGWNSAEVGYPSLLGSQPPTLASYRAAVAQAYGEQAAQVLAAYPASTDAEVPGVATDLATDRFTAYATWKWATLHTQTSGQPVYRYLYAHPRPPMRPELGNAVPGLAGGIIRRNDAPPAPPASGAVHSAEIEYALGNLTTNHVYAWTAEDYRLSTFLQDYFVAFIKTGNPNGNSRPNWPAATRPPSGQTMLLDVAPRAATEPHPARYHLLDHLAGN
ncbi:MAG: carboxylesterase family protein [Hymenobacter sp.]|nr:MAG: carboxylesterase family protein [Hymenobacter sp.]